MVFRDVWGGEREEERREGSVIQLSRVYDAVKEDCNIDSKDMII